jgi:hypothetical protein
MIGIFENPSAVLLKEIKKAMSSEPLIPSPAVEELQMY